MKWLKARKTSATEMVEDRPINPTLNSDYIVTRDERILVTGSSGFIGSKVVEKLLEYGFANLRCFVRPSPRPLAYGSVPLPGAGHPYPAFCCSIMGWRTACNSLCRSSLTITMLVWLLMVTPLGCLQVKGPNVPPGGQKLA